MKKSLTIILLGLTWIGSTGCFYSKTADRFSPFRDPGPPDENIGDTTNKTILEETGGSSTGGSGDANANNARSALQSIGSYRAANDPQPYYPVMNPAEVRLMWVPDHTNTTGDLIPAHYYYLKVLEGGWAVQDPYEWEDQLNRSTKGKGSTGGATPWVYGEPNKK